MLNNNKPRSSALRPPPQTNTKGGFQLPGSAHAIEHIPVVDILLASPGKPWGRQELSMPKVKPLHLSYQTFKKVSPSGAAEM